ncbi:diguanylate cyclase [Cryptosporangium sp. NPDC048952]|uniref:GGDEF domain-containing protein n=1 Tax=Cryptosporangium sp. NPDC048952 TaxID=3363961 RepID=UPI003711D37D
MGASLVAVAYALVIAACLVYVVVVVRAWRMLPMAGALIAASLGVAGSSLPLLAGALRSQDPAVNAFTFTSATLTLAGCIAIGVRTAAPQWRPGRWLLLLGVEPVLIGLAAATNGRHHLLIADPGTSAAAGAMAAPPPMATLYLLYLALVTIGAVAFVGRQILQRRVRGARAWLSLLAVLLPASGAGTSMVSYLHGGMTRAALLAVTVGMVVFLGGLIQGVFRLLPIARASILNTMDDAVTVIDADRRVVTANPAARALVARLAPHVRRLQGALITDVASDLRLPETDTSETVDITIPDTDEHLEMRVTLLRGRRGAVIGWTLVSRDVTAARRQQRALEDSNRKLRVQLEVIEALRRDLAEQASRDALTGLHNRRHLMDYLAACDRAAATGTALAVIDIDHFKRINDEYGHPAGDAVLRAVAETLTDGLGQADVVARYGGEEFVCVFTGRSLPEAVETVEALRRRLAVTPIPVGDTALSVTFSAGVACAGAGEPSADLLTIADRALYDAKRAGRNRVMTAARAVSAR